MNWITREHPRVDRIACAWLIRRFVDDQAEFRYVPATAVLAEARRLGAVPFGVPSSEQHRTATLATFDAILTRYRIDDPALALVAAIVRAGHAERGDGALQSAGLLAIAYGLARHCRDDDELLRQGFAVYDALYHWCRKAPPGPDFALRREDARPIAAWRQAGRVRRRARHAARVLAALNGATLREIALERACGEWGQVEAFDARAATARAAAATRPAMRLRPALRALGAMMARAGAMIARTRPGGARTPASDVANVRPHP
jgi:hypothetical protein